jgi:UDP-GlcNAc:undecaprenyl-phosphate/decaprenyl-phosphate GlcNAc-1-phosphate transferase
VKKVEGIYYTSLETMVNSEIRTILVFLVALFSAMYVLPKLARIAEVIGLVDRPAEKRKLHKIPRPLVGGIGMIIAATFSSLILIPISGLRGYFLGLSVLLLVGFFDDFKELGHRQKFIAQIGATVLMIYFSNVSLVTFGDLLGFGKINIPNIPWIIYAVTIFCVVGVINAINLIDGLDGLAGGITFIAFITFAIHASLAGEQTLLLLNMALAGAVLGFLRYNWYPASMFMGDAGSLCLGFSVAFMALVLTQKIDTHVSPVSALLILAVPITDTLTVMGKRILRGQSPFKADQYHLHHIFMRYGMGRALAVKVILVISAVLSGISLLGPIFKLPDWTMFAAFSLYLSIYVISSFCIIYMLRFSLKFQKMSGKSHDNLDRISQFMTGKPGFFQIFRKSPRYNVDLDFICQARDRDLFFEGKLLNISSDGFMASIPQLDCLLNRVVAKITFPLDADSHSIELPAEHIWFAEHGDKYYHGFRFYHFDGEQEQVVFKFLVKFKKKSN